MPWDTDVDVMVDESGIDELGGWWNMSVHHFTGQELGLTRHEEGDDVMGMGNVVKGDEVLRQGKKYLLEVNPYYTNTSTRDRENVIDARWIDTATGLFIDITALHVQPIIVGTTSGNDVEHDDATELYTKDQHAYTSTSMFPLRESVFEDIPVHIPYDYERLLLDEYGPKALTQKVYKDFEFDEGGSEWRLVNGFAREEDEEVVMQRLQAARERMDYLERVGDRNRVGLERYGDVA